MLRVRNAFKWGKICAYNVFLKKTKGLVLLESNYFRRIFVEANGLLREKN